MITGKNILIFGGAGFIGSHMCERLLEQGNHVTCADDLSTGNLRNISSFLENKSFRFIRHDITVPISGLPDLDYIFNMACPASPKHYQSDKIKTLKTCFAGSLNALDLAKRHNASIVFCSTSEVYGCPQVDIQDESYWGYVNPVGARYRLTPL